jgi:murein DD-endopeptidase MepM/ murein hydrolase activator NlpD
MPNRATKRFRVTAALLLAVGVVAVPAGAAGRVPAAATAGDPLIHGTQVARRVAHWAQAAEKMERDRRRAAGPFVPIVGPVDYGTAENAFGAARSDHVHAGQDMFAKPGTAEIAPTDGVVIETGYDGGEGNYVYLYDPKRDRTYVYMHMISAPEVHQGERVHAGQLLGGLGCTGSCWGDHLHFEVRDGRGYAGEARDPLPLLKDWRSLDKPR